MKPRLFFPLGKAYGEAFCNRIEETNKLIGNIESGKHTFVIAPRRYGKSSLCEKVFEKINIPSAKLDLHLAVGEKEAESIIINGVTNLIGKSIGSIEKISHLIKKYARSLNPKFSIGNNDFHLELEVAVNSNPAQNIADALLLLENLLRKKEKQAVLLLDEFQEIGEIERGRAIEGAIRHAAQETNNLALIFSGSNSHLMKAMFEDERRPLYKLCRKIVLDRISKDDYLRHLNKAAKSVWKRELAQEVFERIMLLSERHPYYVNYLCDELWSDVAKSPSVTDVDKAWAAVIEEERSDLIKDFFNLPENQKKILIYIANNDGVDIYSGEATKKMDIPLSSITRALTTLIEKDYVEKTIGHYRIIAPAFKSILKTS